MVKVLQTPPDHLGSWLTFLGVFFGGIIVAVITAVTAQRRLQAQLASEERRHRDQLRFERGEADRAELRSIIDALAERLFGLADAARSMASDMKVESQFWREEKRDEAEKRRVEANDRIRVARDRITEHIERLRLRLGDEGAELVKFATDARAQAVLMWVAPRKLPVDAEELTKLTGRSERIRTAYRAFIAEAFRYTRAELSRPDTAAS